MDWLETILKELVNEIPLVVIMFLILRESQRSNREYVKRAQEIDARGQDILARRDHLFSLSLDKRDTLNQALTDEMKGNQEKYMRLMMAADHHITANTAALQDVRMSLEGALKPYNQLTDALKMITESIHHAANENRANLTVATQSAEARYTQVRQDVSKDMERLAEQLGEKLGDKFVEGQRVFALEFASQQAALFQPMFDRLQGIMIAPPQSQPGPMTVTIDTQHVSGTFAAQTETPALETPITDPNDPRAKG